MVNEDDGVSFTMGEESVKKPRVADILVTQLEIEFPHDHDIPVMGDVDHRFSRGELEVDETEMKLCGQGEGHDHVVRELVVEPFSDKEAMPVVFNQGDDIHPIAGDVGSSQLMKGADSRCILGGTCDASLQVLGGFLATRHRAVKEVNGTEVSEVTSKVEGVGFPLFGEANLEGVSHVGDGVTLGMTYGDRYRPLGG